MDNPYQTDGLVMAPSQPVSYRQLGVIVSDASGSMEDPIINASMKKAAATNIAIRDLFGRLKVSAKASSFEFAHVSFNDKAAMKMGPTPVMDVDADAQYNSGAKDGTFIGSGLGKAFEICRDWFAADDGSVPVSAVILLMSDGEDSDPSLAAQTLAVADEIKRYTHKGQPAITIASCYLASADGGTGAGPAHLQQICSDPQRLYRTVWDANTLRAFWEASLSQSRNTAGVVDHTR